MSRQKRLPALLALACMMTGGPALAVKPPGTLYIKAKNTHLKASSSPTANTLEVLQPGKEVTYEGKEPGSPWCKVRVAQEKKKSPLQGYIYQANLSVSPPSMEVTSKNPGKPLSPQAFASSGAAIKALGPKAITYSYTLPQAKSGEQLEKLNELVLGISDAEVAEYARAGGLPEVVGNAPLAKRPAKKKGGK